MESKSAVALAHQFHDRYERLAPEFGYETRLETRVFDPDSANGRLMIAVFAEYAEELDRLRAEVERLRRGLYDEQRIAAHAWKEQEQRAARAEAALATARKELEYAVARSHDEIAADRAMTRAMALEEAAVIADTQPSERNFGAAIASEIRALKDKKP